MNENWYAQWRIMQDQIAEKHRHAVKRRLLEAVRAEKLLRSPRRGPWLSKPA